MPTTSPSDVAARLGRALTADEENLAATLLFDAENMIRVRAPGMDISALDAAMVKQVAANAVVRVLRNPDGYRSETNGAVSYTIDTRAAAGFLTILDEEWRLLGLAPIANSGMFSIAPHLDTYPARLLYDPGWWRW